MSYKAFFHNSILKSIVFFTFCCSTYTYAHEGMWLPPTLKNVAGQMKAEGLEIPIDEIYNESGTGLNNAVVLFGRGCTGEIISSKGLVLTNHHCGYGSVQALSSVEHDYFATGFWAMNNNEELRCPGLTVTFIRRMENVTDNILKYIPDTLADKQRDSIIADRIEAVEKLYAAITHMDANIKPYYNGNQYWIAISETYRDIRLVGFPPNAIGYFGGDVENWSWPRHTGDFSIFRVYAGKDNKPADYSASNKPYETKEFFTISTKGYKEGDFTMVYGFPGTTEEYITSYQMNQIYSIIDPIAVASRTKILDVWTKHMNASREVFLKYTSKRAGVANGWKKWQGEMRGLQVNNVLAKKQEYETGFQAYASGGGAPAYAKDLLPQMEATALATDSAIKYSMYIGEDAMGIELIRQGATLDALLPLFRAGLSAQALQDTFKKIAPGIAGFFKNYDAATDREVFDTLMPMFFQKCSAILPPYYSLQYNVHNHDFDAWASSVYGLSMMANEKRFSKFAASVQPSDSTRIQSDPAWQLYTSLQGVRKTIAPKIAAFYQRMNYLNRLYMKTRMQRGDAPYPDANLTLRVAFGKVAGIDPEGPAGYSYQTNLDEVVALDDPKSDIFTVPAKLKQLYEKKDYGRWAVNGTVPVAFIAANHTSGGNSGSPVLNAKGQLIGTNFDRVWEGTMSDIYFDPKLCRNISLDVRYTLFVIEKFGNAGWLLNEMKIVKE
jgi:hypothetical protein